MPRKSRKKLVGKAEDVEWAEREKSLNKLERELHQQQEEQSAVIEEIREMPSSADEHEENS